MSTRQNLSRMELEQTVLAHQAKIFDLVDILNLDRNNLSFEDAENVLRYMPKLLQTKMSVVLEEKREDLFLDCAHQYDRFDFNGLIAWLQRVVTSKRRGEKLKGTKVRDDSHIEDQQTLRIRQYLRYYPTPTGHEKESVYLMKRIGGLAKNKATSKSFIDYTFETSKHGSAQKSASKRAFDASRILDAVPV